MKSTIYFTEITNQKAEKYLSRRRKLESTCLLASLLAPFQLRNFPCEFTENCFTVFNQSSHAIYLTWYRSLLIFPELTSIIPFMV